MPTDTQAPAAVVPIRVLAYDGDAAFVVERAGDPPTTLARRFRAESAPVAARSPTPRGRTGSPGRRS